MVTRYPPGTTDTGSTDNFWLCCLWRAMRKAAAFTSLSIVSGTNQWPTCSWESLVSLQQAYNKISSVLPYASSAVHLQSEAGYLLLS